MEHVFSKTGRETKQINRAITDVTSAVKDAHKNMCRGVHKAAGQGGGGKDRRELRGTDRKGLCAEVIFEMCHGMKGRWNNVVGRQKRKCKGPEAGRRVMFPRKGKTITVTGA